MMKLRSWTFVSQPLCCAIPVPRVLPLFLLFPPPAPLPWSYPGVLSTGLFSLISLVSLVPVLASPAPLL